MTWKRIISIALLLCTFLSLLNLPTFVAANVDLADTGANVELAETGANVSAGTIIYFDASNVAESGSVIQFMIGHGSWSQGYPMTKVSNSNLYYVKMDLWEGATEYAIFGCNEEWGGEGSSVSSRKAWAPWSTSVMSAADLSGTVVLTANSSGTLSKSSASLNTTHTATACYQASGGGTYSTGTTGGTVSVSGYNVSGTTGTAKSSSTSGSGISSGVGTTVTMKATAKAGYTFKGWFTSTTATSATSTSATYSYTNTGAAKTYYAKFQLNGPYTVSVKTNSTTYGTVSASPSSVYYGKTTTLTASPKTGYHLSKWAVNSSSYGSLSSTTALKPTLTVYNNVTATATFAANTGKVTFSAGTGGSVSSTGGSTTYNGTSTRASTASASTGYYFTGWTISGGTLNTDYKITSGSTSSASITIQPITNGATITCKANFGTQYKITTQQNWGVLGSVTKSVTYVTPGSTVTLTATPDSGNGFNKWTFPSGTFSYTSGSATSTTITIKPTSNITAQANFYAGITVSAGSGGTVSPSGKNLYGYDTEVTIKATPNPGYHFTGWTFGGTYGGYPSTSSASTTINVRDCTTAKATFAINTYTVTFKDYDGTVLATRTVNHGSAATAPANPSRAATAQYTYTFTGWSTAFNNVTSDLTVTAQYSTTTNTYTVTFKDWNGTTLATRTVEYGKAATAPSNPTRTGYEFAGWDKDFSNITGNLTVTAQYTDVQVYFPGSFNNWSTASPCVVSGNVASTTIHLEPGTYTFKVLYRDGWYGNNGTIVDTTLNTSSTGWEMYTDAGDCTLTAFGGDYTFKFNVSTKMLEITYDPDRYTVTFFNEDGSVIQSGIVMEGKAATAPASPTKAGNAQYSYTFTGWDKSFSNVQSTLDIYPVFKQTVNKYTVTFKNWDGTVLATKSVEYGSAATAPSNPTRPATAQYSYTFTGWDKSFSNITGDLTVTAQYTSTINTYTVTFKNWDGTTLVTRTVEYGKAATAPANPTRPATAQYTYTFSGWDKSFTNITGNLTVTAQYTSTTNKYTVTFKNWDGTKLKEQSVAYGSAATAPANPTRPATAQYTYTFSGWDKDFSKITGNLTVTAQYTTTTNKYTVTFVNWDGTKLKEQSVAYGSAATAPANPTRPATAQYTYTFSGWDKSFTNITGNLTVTAQYTTTTNKYTVTFVNWDGSTIVTRSVEYGKAATAPANPTRPATAQYTYTFSGWDKSFTNITGNLTVTAQYTSTTNKYTVTFKNWDGSTITTQSVAYGSAATAPAAPARDGYEFSGWDTDFSNITGNLTVTAQFTDIQAYLLGTFNDWSVDAGLMSGSDDVVTKTLELEPGTYTFKILHKGVWYGNWGTIEDTTTKTSDVGWEMTDGAGDCTLNATGGTYTFSYNRSTRMLVITFVSDRYTVTFKNWDGTVLKEESVKEGSSATPPANPTRPATAQYTYTFSGWDKAYTNIKADTVLTAQYTTTTNKYTVTFVNWDGSTIVTRTVEYGKGATAPSNPTKPATAQYSYTFSGWDKDFSNITGDLTVTAQYTSKVNTYTVTFKNWDGSTIVTRTVEYGKGATAPAAPTRDGYEFSGWDKDFSNITGNLTVTAQFTDIQAYLLGTFNDWSVDAGLMSGSGDVVTKTIELEPGTYYFKILHKDVWYGNWGAIEDTTTKTSDIGWEMDGSAGECTLNATGGTYTFSYNRSTRMLVITFVSDRYNVTFKNWDGTVLKEQSVKKGSSATPPASPTRPATAQYTYTFNGWDKSFTNIQADTVLTAQYIETVNKYTVTFKDYDGEILKTQSVAYGSAATAPSDPTREGNAQYSYTFKGWDKDFSKITGDLTVTATYTQTVNKYTVVFKNWDGTILSSQSVEYGKSAAAPADPTRPSTEQYSYTFTGWDKDFSNITADLTVTAQYSSTSASFTVTFVNHDGSLLKTQSVAYGQAATAPEAPTRESDVQYSYTFSGWDKDFSKVTGNLTVKALYTATLNEYTVTFVDYDGSTIATQSVAYGSAASAPVAPTRDGYEFSGWDKDFSNITGDLTVTAQYVDATVYLPGSFNDWSADYAMTENADGTVTATFELEEGTYYFKVLYKNVWLGNWGTIEDTTTKTSDIGWEMTDGADNCTLNATGGTYTFIFNRSNGMLIVLHESDKVTVTFKNWDGTVLKEEVVKKGSAATAPETPTKPATAQYSYTFAGWDKDFSDIQADTVVTATYTQVVNKYTVTFKDYDGTVLDTQSVEFGSAAVAPASPSREGYEFAGWDKSFDNITGDLTVTAQYLGLEAYLVGSFNEWATDTPMYTTSGSVVTTTLQLEPGTYTFKIIYGDEWYGNWGVIENTTTTTSDIGWEMDSTAGDCTLNATGGSYTFTYDTSTRMLVVTHVPDRFTVIFKDYDGTVLDTQVVMKGNAATAPANPTREGNAEYSYNFTGWDTAYSNIQADTVVTATYSQSVNEYTVLFKNWDGTVLSTQYVKYGSAATAPADPTRAGDEQTTYTFTGWDKDFSNITGDLTVTAQFTTSSVQYTVTFINWNEAVLKTQKVYYGQAATAPANPTRPTTNQYIFTFAGWDKDFSNITADTIVKATYTAKVNPNVDQSIYNLAADVQKGQILQCWNWSYNNIRANLQNIANQGFSAIQTSPIQATKETTREGYNTVWNSSWVVYQPVSFNIETNSFNALGTKAEFAAMCAEAEKYGIKVIVDTIFNHMANDMTGNTIHPWIPSEIKDDPNCWHDINMNIYNFDNRYDVTHYCLTGLPDLNTANPTVQKYCINFLKEAIDAGADGFRFDAAKHIETDWDADGIKSDFWYNVLGEATSYAQSTKGFTPYYYGEFIGGPTGVGIDAYTRYMSVTDTGANSIRQAVCDGNASAAASSGVTYGEATSKAVLWTESHDNYKDDGTRFISDHNINKTWAIVGSRAEACGLYLARPANIDTTLMGQADVTSWAYPEVKAVNQFKNHFEGQSEYLSSYNNLVCVERGNSGIVIVNTGGTYYNGMSAPVHTMAAGLYTDAITGNVFTVSDGYISGDIGDTGIAVVYHVSDNGPFTAGNPSSVSLVGSFNGWDSTSHVFVGNDKTTASTSIVLEQGTYQFKLTTSTGLWYGNSGTITNTTGNTPWTMYANESSNCTLVASGGKYTFTFDSTTGKITVTRDASGNTNSDIYLKGSFNNWGTENPMVYTGSNNTVTTILTLSAGTYSFKLNNTNVGVWYGNSGTINDTTQNTSDFGWFMSTDVSDNCTLNATGGTYTFRFNLSTNILEVLHGLPEYLVTFKNWDGSVLSTQSVTSGSAAVAPEVPAREGDAQYTYTFSGWDKDFSSITASTTITAVFSQTLNKYPVVFKDWDGTVLSEQSVEYGSAAQAPEEPAREGYEFTGWNLDFSNITGELTVTATYVEIFSEYTVTFVNYDDTVIDTQVVTRGEAAVAPSAPTREADAQYTYTFSGWDTDFTEVKANLTVKALYDTTLNEYTVTFVDSDGEVIETQQVAYGSAATAPQAPDVEDYVFTGWDKDFSNITGELTVTAKYEKIVYYLVGSFNDWASDTEMIKTESGVVSTTITLDTGTYYFKLLQNGNWFGNTGTIEDTTLKTSEIGWEMTLDVDNCTLKASGGKYTFNFNPETRMLEVLYTPVTYTVNFVDFDGTVIKSETVEKGKAATAPEDPVREATAQYTYTFSGWDIDFFDVQADLTVTATYESTLNQYTVTFVDYDGTEIKTVTVDYGTAAIAPAPPTRDGYDFAGWDKDYSNITEDLTITATYAKILDEYTVEFVDYDGTVISTQVVARGENATAPEDPVREGDAQYTYTFTGWDTDFTNVKAHLTVKAQYDVKVNEYTVTFIGFEGEVLDTQQVAYGSAAVAPQLPFIEGYDFMGWDNDFSSITGELTVTAKYEVAQYYLVGSFNNWSTDTVMTEAEDGIVSAKLTLLQGTYYFKLSYNGTWFGNTGVIEDTTLKTSEIGWEMIADAADCTLVASGGYYTFNFNTATGMLEVIYEPITYTVEFVDFDGKLIKTETVEEGKAATAPEDPTREGYTFTGWDKDFSAVTSDLTVKATYIRTNITYTVTFVDYDGTVLKSQIVTTGESAEAPEVPEREGYVFLGWDKEFSDITQNLTVNALYEDIRVYLVGSFNDWATDKAMTVTENEDIVSVEVMLSEGQHFFKLLYKGVWYTNTGVIEDSTLNTSEIGWEMISDAEAGNCTLDASGGKYIFSFNTSTKFLEIVYVPVEYTVVFKDFDDTVLSEEKVKYGAAATAPEAPEREGYYFSGWDKEFDFVEGSMVVTAQYVAVGSTYTVTFVDFDGTELKSEEVEYGKSATAPEAPARLGYIFTGWDKEFDTITGDLTVVAQYKDNTVYIYGSFNDWAEGVGMTFTEGSDVVSYELTLAEGEYFFKLLNLDNWYGNSGIIEDTTTATSAVGWEMIVDGENCTLKASGGKYTFNFNMTTKSLEILYTPVEYTVEFVGFDGEILSTQTVKLGADAKAPEVSEIEGYIFSGWDNSYENIGADVVVTAVYIKDNTKFTVTFVDFDGTVLDTQELEYGESATAPEDPVRIGYIFTGWDKKFDKITENTTIKAQYKDNQIYLVASFNDWATDIQLTREGTSDYFSAQVDLEAGSYFFKLLQNDVWYTSASTIIDTTTVTSDTGIELRTNAELGDTILNASGGTYTFRFNVLTNELEVLYTVEVIKEFTVIFVDFDGKVISTQTVTEGEAAIAPEAPTREGYTFTGWDKEFSNITSDLTVTAQYIQNVTSNVSIAGTFNGWTPAKDFFMQTADSNVVTMQMTLEAETYMFKVVEDGSNWFGCDNTIVDVTTESGCVMSSSAGNCTLVASGGTYTFTYNKLTKTLTVSFDGETDDNITVYTVTFVDSDGTVISEQTVLEGGSATAPAAPSKAGYVFKGWDKSFTNVTSDLTVTAQYVAGSYSNVSIAGDFNGWNSGATYFIKTSGSDLVTLDMTLESGTYKFKVVENGADWYGNNGVIIDTTTATSATGWGMDASAGDCTLVASGGKYTFQYNPSTHTLIILYDGEGGGNIPTCKVTFVDYNGRVISTQNVKIGSAAKAPADPYRAGYKFTGWDTDFSYVTSDLTVTAQYIDNNVYLMGINGDWENGIKLSLVSGTTYRGSVKLAAGQYKFKLKYGYDWFGNNGSFEDTTNYTSDTGWEMSTDAGDCTLNASGSTYTFTFNTATRMLKVTYIAPTYTVTFKNWNGATLKTQYVTRGNAATPPANPTRSGYIFSGWDTDFSWIWQNTVVTAKFTENVVDLMGDMNGWSGTSMTNIYGSTFSTTMNLAAGTYKFKVKHGDTWYGNNGSIDNTTTATSAVGWEMTTDAGDCTLNASGGSYTFTFDTNTRMLIITYVGSGTDVPVGDGSVFLRGTLTNWETGEQMTATETKDVYSYTLDLAAGSYTFKIYIDGVWYGNSGAISNATDTGWVMDATAGDCTLNASGGKYTFTFNKATNTLEVSYVGDGTGEDIPVPGEAVYLRGTLTNWETGALMQATDTEKVYTYSIDLEVGTAHEFKVFYGGQWYGFNGTVDDATESAVEMTTDAGNATLIATTGGTYIFKFNTETNTLEIELKVEDPDDPINPDNPATGDEVDPDEPIDPDNPSTGDEVDPDEPVDPDNPDNPATGDEEDPSDPTDPSDPSDPTDPDVPEDTGPYEVTWNAPERVTLVTDADLSAVEKGSDITISFQLEEGYRILAVVYNMAILEANADGTYTLRNITSDTKFIVLVEEIPEEPDVMKFTVTFTDKNGNVISTDTVGYGQAATAPQAPQINGYTFSGWDTAFDYVTKDITVKARYTKIVAAQTVGVLELDILGGSGFTISVNGSSERPQGTSYYNTKAPIGATVTVVAHTSNGNSFIGWMNDDGVIVSTSETFTFVTSGNDYFRAVYQTDVDDVSVVIFKNDKAAGGNGQILSMEYYASGEEIIFPDDPVTIGYEFLGWSYSDIEIDARIRSGEKVITVYARWNYEATFIDVIVNGGRIDSGVANAEGKYARYGAVTVVADAAPAGSKFAYWIDENGKVVSYDQEYKFYPCDNTTITAVYVAEDASVEQKVLVNIAADPTYDGEKISYILSWDVPEQVGTFKLAGMIIVNKNDYNPDTFYHGTTDSRVFDRALSGSALKPQNTYAINKGASYYGNTYVACTWIQYEVNGETITVYSEPLEVTKVA